jgi:hypothetical protein
MTTILKQPILHYSAADVELSVEKAKQLKAKEAGFSQMLEKYNQAGLITLKAKQKLQNAVDSGVLPHEVEKLRRDHQQCVWHQTGIKQGFQKECQAIKNKLERLVSPLISHTHQIWVSELRGLSSLEKSEVKSSGKDIARGIKYANVSTNRPAISEAKKILEHGLKTISSFRTSSIPEAQAFIDNVEAGLRKIDLSEMTEFKNLTASRAQMLTEKGTNDGPMQSATRFGPDEVYIHPQKGDVQGLSDRIAKLEKNL